MPQWALVGAGLVVSPCCCGSDILVRCLKVFAPRKTSQSSLPHTHKQTRGSCNRWRKPDRDPPSPASPHIYASTTLRICTSTPLDPTTSHGLAQAHYQGDGASHERAVSFPIRPSIAVVSPSNNQPLTAVESKVSLRRLTMTTCGTSTSPSMAPLSRHTRVSSSANSGASQPTDCSQAASSSSSCSCQTTTP